MKPRPNAGTGGDPGPVESRNARHRTTNRKDNDGQTSVQRHPGGSPGATRGGKATRNKGNESTTTASRANTSARARAQAAGERKGERTTRAPEDTSPSRSGTTNEPKSRPTPRAPSRRPTHGEDRKGGGKTTDSKESRENESVSAAGTTNRDAKAGAQNGADDRGDKRERRRPKTTGPSKDDQRTGRHETPPGEKEEPATKRTPGDHRRATRIHRRRPQTGAPSASGGGVIPSPAPGGSPAQRRRGSVRGGRHAAGSGGSDRRGVHARRRAHEGHPCYAEPDDRDPRRARPGGIIWEPGERQEKPMRTTAHCKEALTSQGGGRGGGAGIRRAKPEAAATARAQP